MSEVDRTRGIGGSDIGAILGVNPHRKPWDVWAEKVGEAPPPEGNEFTEFGNRFEGAIADAYAARREEDEPEVRVCEPDLPFYTDDRESWIRATPDRLVRDGRKSVLRGLEIKTAGLFTPTSVIRDQWGEGDDVPNSYFLQCVWYMRVINVPRWDIAAFIGGVGYREYQIMRNRKLEDGVVKLARNFWADHVLKKAPPPVDSSEACDAGLRRLYPRHRRDMIVATPDMATAAFELRDAEAALKEAEERARLAKSTVQSMIGDAEGMRGEKFVITWRASNRTNHEAAAREAGVSESIVLAYSSTAWAKVTKEAKVSKAILERHTELRGGPRSLRKKWA